MKNICPFYIAFQVLKVLLPKICKTQPSSSFKLGFTSGDIIFQKCLDSTLPEKKKIVTNLPFLTDLLKPPFHSLNSQVLLSATKVFCQCSL